MTPSFYAYDRREKKDTLDKTHAFILGNLTYIVAALLLALYIDQFYV
jgi:hypothetical protein